MLNYKPRALKRYFYGRAQMKRVHGLATRMLCLKHKTEEEADESGRG